MSLIGRRVVFRANNLCNTQEGLIVDKVIGSGLELFCIENNNGDAHFVTYSDIVSFINKKEEPKTIRIMANSFYNFDVDFDYRDVKSIPTLGVELCSEVVYDSTLDRDNNPLLLVTKVEHKANGLVCVYVEPVND